MPLFGGGSRRSPMDNKPNAVCSFLHIVRIGQEPVFETRSPGAVPTAKCL